FYAASTNPVAERAPYYDPQHAELLARQADAVARQCEQEVERLPPEGERPALRKELYAFLLQWAHLKGQTRAGAEAALALLERAAALQEPTRGYYRLRADCYDLLDRPEPAQAARQRAEQAPATALDYFLQGERYRRTRVPEEQPGQP